MTNITVSPDCPICGRLWDLEAFSHQAEVTVQPFGKVVEDFNLIGCEALGTTHTKMKDYARQQVLKTRNRYQP